MSKHEKPRRHILESQRCDPSGDLHYRTIQLAHQFGLSESQVQHTLGRMADEGLISLAGWDGERVRPIHEWPSASAFFNSTLDGGHVRIHVLAPGAELLAELPKAKLGFV
jgi:DNA-binding IclR family transcriptional regulator